MSVSLRATNGDDYLDAGGDGDADGVDKLRRDAKTFPRGRRQPALVNVRLSARRPTATPIYHIIS